MVIPIQKSLKEKLKMCMQKESVLLMQIKKDSWRKKEAFPNNEERGNRFVDAIREGLRQSMIAHPDLILMGQDIAEYGGAFKVTEGLMKEFGKERVRNTPLCESAIVGASLGLSLEGFKSVVEMQFADFVSVGFNQIVNNLAKIQLSLGAKCRCGNSYANRCRS